MHFEGPSALRSPSLRCELTTAHRETTREQGMPLRMIPPGSGIVGKRLPGTLRFARGPMKSFRAPRANSQCSSTSSVTVRASSRRREQASRSSELDETPSGGRARGGRCSLPACRSSYSVHLSLHRRPRASRWNAPLGPRGCEAVRGAACSLVLKARLRVTAGNLRRKTRKHFRATQRARQAVQSPSARMPVNFSHAAFPRKRACLLAVHRWKLPDCGSLVRAARWDLA